MKFTFGNTKLVANTFSAHKKGLLALVQIPQEVYNNQREFDKDGQVFPCIRLRDNKRIQAQLCGNLYDLHGVGTGSIVVKVVSC